ncbi:MAG: hypothetical protein OXE78_11655 [Gammaproteobacteria bacterium]|nr:hypothetical protein [Gammaproteobacteria bacterium]
MKPLTMLACGTVGLVVVIGLYINGSPASQRSEQLDALRVNQLQGLSQNIEDYWQRTGQLPARLEELIDGLHVSMVPLDPVSATEYGYEIKGENGFSLCADFVAASAASVPSGFWEHGAGHQCFNFQFQPTSR